MKQTLCFLSCILVVGLLPRGLPAAEQPAEGTRFGVGISLFEEFLSFAGPLYSRDVTGGVTAYVPVRHRGVFRVEPELGIWYSSYDYVYEEEVHEAKERTYIFGLGIMPIIRRDKLDIYYGIRIGVAMTLQKLQRTVYIPAGSHEERSKTDWYFGPTIGGEFFASEHFSVGGEVRLEFAFYDEWDETDPTNDLFTIHNRNLFFVRWYF